MNKEAAYKLGVKLALQDAGLVKEALGGDMLAALAAGAGGGALGGLTFGDAQKGAVLGAGVAGGGVGGHAVGKLIGALTENKAGLVGKAGRAAPWLGAGLGGGALLAYLLKNQ